MTVVRTREELSAAKERGDVEIMVEGELATKLWRARPIIYCGAGAIAVITAAIAAAPFTFGASLAAAAGFTGIEIVAIIIAVSMGLGLLLAIWRDYDVEFSAGPPPKMTLRKKRK